MAPQQVGPVTTTVTAPNAWSNFQEIELTPTPNVKLGLTVSVPADGSGGATKTNVSWEVWGRQSAGAVVFKVGGWDTAAIMAGAGLLGKNQAIPAGSSIPYSVALPAKCPAYSLLFRHKTTGNPNVSVSSPSTVSYSGQI